MPRSGGARSFDGVDDYISGTITAIDTGDWTAGAWIYPLTSGEGQQGAVVLAENAGSSRQHFGFNFASDRAFRCRQNFSTTSADTVTSALLPLNQWSCVIGTFRDSDKKCRIYIGDRSTAPVEVAYSSQNAGVGARGSGGTTLTVGNDSTQALTFNGRIARPFLAPSEWTTAQMDDYRLGAHADQITTCRFSWRTSASGTPITDHSTNGVVGTVSGTIEARGPF